MTRQSTTANTEFAVGDLVTEHFLGDGHPAVVVHATPKTVWVRRVDFVTNAQPNDIPGYNGYGDSATIVIDPESVEQALAAGKDGARKYLRKERRDGGIAYRLPNSTAGSLSRGAKFRRDPHV